MHPAHAVREAREGDLDALTDVWERAARSSHAFMGDEEIAGMRPFIRDAYLPSMDVWLVEDGNAAIAFVGARDSHVELLYVDPPFHGRGLGTYLLARVGATSVEVYEGNDTGLGFYRSQGFVAVRRRDRDAAGRPFPMVVLER
ncbi:GNAT family N-acetyltransferase [Aeromicrobium sp. S22]|uniref:GNAT family N-acetyltransferase n=1 Tax=Aeromicrobium sp. S22 TaxID=2662029 RepID=UPI00129EB5CD|nr:GNAT family N-acetyltransferase [Aeromicrobium sp. S22]MRK00681.1 GNAT family N-acetyltransferase [Aeromicrobium sp. S22]